MAELVFFTGTMDCGKSTLALQMHHTHRSAGRHGLLLTRHDRAGAAVVPPRLGLQAPAVEVSEHLNLWGLVVDRHVAGEQVDYVVCDEAQFLTVAQVDELAQLGQRRLTRAAASIAARDSAPARIDLDAVTEQSTRSR